MVAAYLGKGQYFAIGATAGSLTEISRDADGLSNVSTPVEVGVRDIPGTADDTFRQSLERKSRTLSFEVDANSRTWSLLFEKTGETLYYEHGPRGNGSGMPKRTGQAIITVTEDYPTDDAIRFSVTGQVNGAQTSTTY